MLLHSISRVEIILQNGTLGRHNSANCFNGGYKSYQQVQFPTFLSLTAIIGRSAETYLALQEHG